MNNTTSLGLNTKKRLLEAEPNKKTAIQEPKSKKNKKDKGKFNTSNRPRTVTQLSTPQPFPQEIWQKIAMSLEIKTFRAACKYFHKILDLPFCQEQGIFLNLVSRDANFIKPEIKKFPLPILPPCQPNYHRTSYSHFTKGTLGTQSHRPQYYFCKNFRQYLNPLTPPALLKTLKPLEKHPTEVTKINLSSLELNLNILATISKAFPNLKTIEITNCELSKVKPKNKPEDFSLVEFFEIFRANPLTTISVNQFYYDIPIVNKEKNLEFAPHKTIQVLDLKMHTLRLSEEEIFYIFQLPNLEKLSVNYSILMGGNSPKDFKQLKNLTKLKELSLHFLSFIPLSSALAKLTSFLEILLSSTPTLKAINFSGCYTTANKMPFNLLEKFKNEFPNVNFIMHSALGDSSLNILQP